MATYNYKMGLGNVGSYQVSGKPYVSSSIVVPAANDGFAKAIVFPAVTKSILVRNDGSPTIRCGFSALGTSGSVTMTTPSNYFTLTQNSSLEMELKVSRLYLMSDSNSTSTATVIAGLTSIETGSLLNNWSGSIGIG
jgi:hypothetical protein